VILAFHKELAYHSLSLLTKIFYELSLSTLLELPLQIKFSFDCPISILLLLEVCDNGLTQ